MEQRFSGSCRSGKWREVAGSVTFHVGRKGSTGIKLKGGTGGIESLSGILPIRA